MVTFTQMRPPLAVFHASQAEAFAALLRKSESFSVMGDLRCGITDARCLGNHGSTRFTAIIQSKGGRRARASCPERQVRRSVGFAHVGPSTCGDAEMPMPPHFVRVAVGGVYLRIHA